MNNELFLALKTGNASLIKGLDRQVLLEVTFEGDTPLHIAIRPSAYCSMDSFREML